MVRKFEKNLSSKFNITNKVIWLISTLIFTLILGILQGSIFNLFILNYLMFLSITSIMFLFKKQKTVYFLLSGCITSVVIASSIIMRFRGTPLTAADLYSIRDGLSIAQKYLGSNFFIIIAVILIVAIVLLVMAFKKEKKVDKLNYKRSIIIITSTVVLTCGLYKFDDSRGFIKSYNWDLASTYKSNGFLVSYSKSVKELKYKKPEGYNKESIAKIKDKLGSETAKVNASNEKPNIIMVQLESFIDPYRLKGVKFTEDPIPNIRKLEEEGPHGLMAVPTFGGGTVRTEFEVLTGYSASNLGAGEIPNNTILKKTAVESLATILKDKGYGVTGIHDYEGNFYDRDTVYSNYGFDKFVSMEYIKNLEYNGDSIYPSDMNNMKPIEEVLSGSKDTPQFIFNVAVESHGPYSTTYKPADGKYTVEGNISDEERNQLQEFVDKAKEVDKYVGALVDYVKQSGKPTIIGFYSDHLPALKLIDNPNNFNSNEKYKSNYFIWSNTGIKLAEKDISAYQLSTYVLNLAGLEGGIMPTFHKLNSNSPDYESDLKKIQYDQLSGDNYLGAEKPQRVKDMELGLDDIKVTKAYMYNGNLVVEGENFTKASKVNVNNKILATKCENPNQLIVYNPGNIDSFKVSQIGKNNKVLSSTEVYIMKK